MRKATLRDVAKEAGVSLSTASLVLNRKGLFSQEVRDRVAEAAQKLAYARLAAANGARKYQGTVAILVFEDPEKAFVWDFFRRIILPLEAVIARARFCAVIIPVSLRHDAQEVFEKVAAAKVQALFSIDYGNAELFQRLEAQGIPVVVINNSSFQTQCYSVCVDDFHGAYEGAKHLLTSGHRQLLYVEYDRPDMPALLNDRFIGFTKALDEAKIPFPDADRLTVNLFDMAALQRQLQQIFQCKPAPTAIFAHDDYLAARIIVALRNLHIAVPAEATIIAPGDTLDYAQPFTPQITTMCINNELMGKLAGEMLLERLRAPQQPLHVLKVNQQLIDRGSCQPLAA